MMKFPLLHAILGKAVISYTWLLCTALFFTAVVTGLLLFALFYLHRNGRRQQRKAQLLRLFSDLVAETVICESAEEVEQALQQFLVTNSNLLNEPFPRRVLIKEIVKTKGDLNGSSAENLCTLFDKLELDKDTLVRLQSKEWHRKASAIQHLAEMKQAKHLVKIYRETNHANDFIRTEAQIAVVKLTGFQGLRFLNVVHRPVSQWQQLSFISQLQESELEEDKIKLWLSLKNDSVVEFALRLITIYKCHGLHDEVTALLQHSSAAIRLQALQALKEIGNESTSDFLLQNFPAASREEQLITLDMLRETGGSNKEMQFLTTLLKSDDEAIRFRALQAMQKLSPAWSAVVIRRMRDHPDFTYILSLLEKQAV